MFNPNNAKLVKALKAEFTCLAEDADTKEQEVIKFDFDFKNSQYSNLECVVEVDDELDTDWDLVKEPGEIEINLPAPSEYGNTHMINLTVYYDGETPIVE